MNVFWSYTLSNMKSCQHYNSMSERLCQIMKIKIFEQTLMACNRKFKKSAIVCSFQRLKEIIIIKRYLCKVLELRGISIREVMFISRI